MNLHRYLIAPPLSRSRKDREARMRKIADAKAFVFECFRQFSEAFNKYRPETQAKISKRVAEELASISAWSAEQGLEHARFLRRLSQIYAELAAEENDPDRKQRRLALSEKLASDAALTEKEAEETTQEALALKQDATAVAASPSNEKEAEETTQEALALKQDATAVSASPSNEKEAEEATQEALALKQDATAVSASPSNEKEAEEATQEALALKQDVTAISASHSNSDTD